MRIEYQLTFDDYLEASRAQTRIRLWFLTVLLAAISMAVILPPVPPSAAMGLGALYPLLLWVGIFVVVWLIVFFVIRGNFGKPWRNRSRHLRGPLPAWLRRFVVPIASISGIVWAMSVRVSSEIRSAHAAGSLNSDFATSIATIVSTAPMALYAVIPAVAGIFTRKGGFFGYPYGTAWKNQPQLRRPLAAEFSNEKCIISEPLSHHEYHWDYFPGWTETPNLFLLFITSRMVHILPKRAFANDTQRAEFVALVDRSISERLPAFPVMAVSPRQSPPPLPVSEG